MVILIMDKKKKNNNNTNFVKTASCNVAQKCLNYEGLFLINNK